MADRCTWARSAEYALPTSRRGAPGAARNIDRSAALAPQLGGSLPPGGRARSLELDGRAQPAPIVVQVEAGEHGDDLTGRCPRRCAVAAHGRLDHGAVSESEGRADEDGGGEATEGRA